VRRGLKFVALGYLIGAVPVPYLFGRIFADADLRRTGTGVAGAANLASTNAGWAVAPAGVIQILQGWLPPALARARGEPHSVQVCAGMASVLAQDWNPFLGLRGGRGMAHSIGFLLALSPPSLAAFALCGVLGRLANQVPISLMAGLALSAPLAACARRPVVVAAGCGFITALAAFKRLLGNDGLPDGPGARRKAVWRLLFDRDVPDREEWLRSLGPPKRPL
jgi:glycerol-3-phosphate acyltransferase PlsY